MVFGAVSEIFIAVVVAESLCEICDARVVYGRLESPGNRAVTAVARILGIADIGRRFAVISFIAVVPEAGSGGSQRGLIGRFRVKFNALACRVAENRVEIGGNHAQNAAGV